MGFGELTGGGEHEVDRGVGKLGQALGAERSDRKGMGKYNDVPIGRSMSPVWELGRVGLDRSLGPNRELECPSVGSVKAFQIMVQVGV